MTSARCCNCEGTLKYENIKTKMKILSMLKILSRMYTVKNSEPACVPSLVSTINLNAMARSVQIIVQVNDSFNVGVLSFLLKIPRSITKARKMKMANAIKSDIIKMKCLVINADKGECQLKKP